MIEFYSEIWPAFVSISKRLGSIEKLDLLTGYLGAGAHKVLKKLNVKRARIVFGLGKTNPSLPKPLLDELQVLRKISKIRIYPGLHSKIFLFDGKVLALGSANFTKSGFGTLQESIVVTDEPDPLEKAISFFKTIWMKSWRLPTRIREASRPAYDENESEGSQGLGRRLDPKRSPFDPGSPPASKNGTPPKIQVRICAYTADWLEEKNSFIHFKRITWTSGRRIKPGDVQLFCISPKNKNLLTDPEDPRVDAVHSIWKATSEVKSELGNEDWPDQANFKLLVRLENPVPKEDLVKGKILVRPRWPQGSAGKLLHSDEEMRNLGEILSRKNPHQRREILKALGL